MTATKLPKGWSQKPLASLVHPDRKISYGVVQPGDFEPNGILLVRGQDYSDGWAKPDSMFRVSEAIDAPYRRARLKTGDIVMTIVGAGTGNIAIVPDYLDGANITQTTARIAVNKTIADRDFIRLVLESHIGRHEVYRNIKGGAQPGLNIGDVEKFQIPTPPLAEQCKIAITLMPWITALEKLDALIAAKARRKEALMQQLLTGQRRLPEFNKPWVQTTFGQFLAESRIEGSDGLTAQKITVKLYGRGVLAKQERMVGSSNTKYFIRRAGQLIYSKLDFLNGAFGIIPPELDGYESTLDLPAFDVKPSADARWLLAYLVRPEFYEKQVGAAAGGRIARRVNPPEFLKLRIKAPEVSEQRAIAAVLSTADAELRLLCQQRTALDHQKRGLMQQLLTGKKRVTL